MCVCARAFVYVRARVYVFFFLMVCVSVRQTHYNVGEYCGDRGQDRADAGAAK